MFDVSAKPREEVIEDLWEELGRGEQLALRIAHDLPGDFEEDNIYISCHLPYKYLFARKTTSP